jgi:hypothetical protein
MAYGRRVQESIAARALDGRAPSMQKFPALIFPLRAGKKPSYSPVSSIAA